MVTNPLLSDSISIVSSIVSTDSEEPKDDRGEEMVDYEPSPK
jgi:hypothetical protein